MRIELKGRFGLQWVNVYPDERGQEVGELLAKAEDRDGARTSLEELGATVIEKEDHSDPLGCGWAVTLTG